ncbi:MAG: hypothetical protein AAGL89_10410 [Pseudomonadota bacterium]
MGTAPTLPPRLVGSALAIYVVIALVGHWLLGPAYVWEFATVLLVAMTVTYPTEAALKGHFLKLELAIALGLSVLALVGLWLSPWLIIIAVFAHGVLDYVKHNGFGIPFHGFYLAGCAAFDVTYAVILTIYLFSTGGAL